MGATITTPNEGDWEQAIKNLYMEGDLTSEQMETCLQRLQRAELPIHSDIMNTISDATLFTCPVCKRTKYITKRGTFKRGWCRNCEDELIGDMM